MIKKEFNHDLQILEITYKGKISYEDLLQFGEEVSKNTTWPRKLNMLTDVREAEYIFPTSKMKDIRMNMEEHLKSYELVKAAFLQIKPKETAMSMVLEKKHTIEKYIHRIFYTKQAALDWLLNKKSK